MPLWSRPPKGAPGTGVPAKPHVPSEPTEPEEFTSWLSSLRTSAPTEPGRSTLLNFYPLSVASLDFSEANPSGLIQLLSGRRTRVSTLLLNQDAQEQASVPARHLANKIAQLRQERGIAAGYVAMGLATFTREGEDFSAPVLLAPVNLIRLAGSDYELQLTGRAFMNPALLEQIPALAQAQEESPLENLGYSTARLDPQAVLEKVRSLCEGQDGITITAATVVSTFADFALGEQDPRVSSKHPVLQALASGATELDQNLPEAEELTQDGRDPEEEWLVLDADQDQERIINQVAAGGCLVAQTPPGSGATQTLINALATVVAQGKRALVVAERTSTIEELEQRLAEVELDSFFLSPAEQNDAGALRKKVIRALIRNERSEYPELGNLYDDLKDVRHRLMDHVASLHTIRARWDASPYQAMQALASLTAMEPAPATTIRLKRSVLDALGDRNEARELLARAAELGTFSAETAQSPWFGARLSNAQVANEAMTLAQELDRELPGLLKDLETVASVSEITPAQSFEQWGELLGLLVNIRGSLDKFKPDIFDRPVTDLISATGSNTYRRERGIEMSSMTRSRLRRVAKEYIRPGVHIDDLQESLIAVQKQRDAFEQVTASKRHPTVPAGLPGTQAEYERIREKLSALETYLTGSALAENLSELSTEELREFIHSLGQDHKTLDKLPEQTLILEQLRAQGLSEFIADIAQREVPAQMLSDELELAWWQSALEAMISGDDYLAMSDGESLRKIEAEYRLADKTHIASTPARLAHHVRLLWHDLLVRQREDAARLKESLNDSEFDINRYLRQAPEFLASLTPIVALSPYSVQNLWGNLPANDVLFLLDAGSMDVATATGAIARAEQIVAFGDLHSQVPQNFDVAVRDEGERPRSEITSIWEALSKFLPQFSTSTIYRTPDPVLQQWLATTVYQGEQSAVRPSRALTDSRPAVSVEFVPSGTGMPGADRDAVESTRAEVERVVELVLDHIRLRPRNSLAVITPSPVHLAHIEKALDAKAQDSEEVRDFFEAEHQPFSLELAENTPARVKDFVIVSLGYGRTPHGRALYDFGVLSGAQGEQVLTNMLTRSRYLMHVLSSILPEHVDQSRLNGGAAEYFAWLDSVLDENSHNPGVKEHEDPLIQDLIERLEEFSVDVRAHFDPALELVAQANRDDESGSELGSAENIPPLAMLFDGTEQYADMSVRERSRLLPERLERLGYRYIPLWAIEVFSDPQHLAQHLASWLNSNLEETQDAHEPQEQSTAEEPAEITGVEAFNSEQFNAEELNAEVFNAEELNAEEFNAAEPSSDPELPGPVPSSPLTRREVQGSQQANKSRNWFNKRDDTVIPKLAKEDDPASWQERSELGREQWLKEQRPPHHGG